MDVAILIKILLVIIFLLTLAFLSIAEVALFSFDKKKLREFVKENNWIGKLLESLVNHSQRLLVTILFGTTVVSVAASILSVDIALVFAKQFQINIELAIIIQIIILTVLILFIGEVTPKVWANKHPEIAARLVTLPMYWINVLFYPVSKIITELLKFFTKNIDLSKTKNALQEHEITELANFGIEKGTIEEDEHELIHGIVSFKTVTAREIMTPRVDISAISVEDNYDTLMNVINESGHSRIPLYEDSLDKIIGIIYAKDLLPYLKNPELRNKLTFKNMMREVLFIPSTKLINDLLHEFQEKKIHLGIVVDEYGGTAGLISLEDILEEIVGEIRDEHDKEEMEINKLDENKYLVLGKVSIDEINDLLASNFSSENDDYDTVGGFIFNQAGSIPQTGYNFVLNGYRFTIKEIVNKRVNKVLVEKVET